MPLPGQSSLIFLNEYDSVALEINYHCTMFAFSVVIVCRNEEAIIGKTLQALQSFAPDVVVYDNGSTDNTIEIVKSFPVNLVQGAWEGFGKTKNKANACAKHDWILSLDADEIPDEELKQFISGLNNPDERTVFNIRFKNFFGEKWIRYGEWGGDKHIRLFNRRQVGWNEAEVHEQLIFPEEVKKEKLSGRILHYTVRNKEEYKTKMKNYAQLNAEKYFRQGKRGSWWKQWLSPVFSFIQNYILRAGFLDGGAGLTCAYITACYTFLKYKKLHALTDKG
jgi:glycosyltransferase involved in cell wall biosynthesis